MKRCHQFIWITIVTLLALCTLCMCERNGVSGSADNTDAYTIETLDDPNVPYVREEWQSWIRANHHRIQSLNSENFDDLHYLDQFVADKSIILLGEEAHGIAEQNRIRVRLIKYLHQVHGFDVIAFESGLYDCYFADRDLLSSGSVDVLLNALHPFWVTTDLVDLVDYVKQSYSGSSPIHLAGFDFHASGLLSLSRPRFFREMVSHVDSMLSNGVFEADSIIVQRRARRSFVDNYVAQHYETLYPLYQDLVDAISNNREVLESFYSEEVISMALKCAVSVRQYIMSRHDPPSYIIRDKQMAENVKYIKEDLFPGKRIIIWAHNGHIQKDIESVAILPECHYYSGTNMGNYLFKAYGIQLYSIGSLAYRGHINYGEVQDIQIEKPESIEAILYHARKRYCFIDFTQQSEQAGNSWIFQKITQKYIHRTGAFDIQYVPKDQYDGILFIDTVTEPEYLY